MAKQVLHRITDDFDGSDGATTIAFALDGVAYTIDLNQKHASELRAILEPFVGPARRESGRAGRGPAVRTGDRDRNQAIRAWALSEGVELPSRGRIALAVQAAFDEGDVDALYAATGLERD